MSTIVARPVTSCSTGPAPTSTGCFPGVNIQQIIPQTETLTVDSVLTSLYLGVKWLIVVVTTSYDRMMAYELYATEILGTSADWVQYAISPNTISHIPNVSIIGGALTLTIDNTDTEDIAVFATRIGIPSSSSILPPSPAVEFTSIETFLPGSATINVDSYMPEETFGVKWFLSVSTPTGSQRQLFQVFSAYGPDSSPYYVDYGYTGNLTINVSADVIIVGSQATLQLTNNTAVGYDVAVIKMPIQSIPVPSTCETTCNPSAVCMILPNAVVIPPTNTTSVDTAAIPGYGSVKWLVNVYSSTKTMQFEVCVTRQALSSASFVQYALIGNSMSIIVNCTIVGANFNLEITNNESSSITVTTIRIPINA